MPVEKNGLQIAHSREIGFPDRSLGSLCVRLSKSRVRFLGRRFVRRPRSASILFGDRAWQIGAVFDLDAKAWLA